MAKKNGKLLLITVILSLLIISSAYSARLPNVYATEITVQERGFEILENVVDFDTGEYSINAKSHLGELYQDVLPQEIVRFKLNSNRSNIDVRSTFVNGKLLMLDVLEIQGSPILTKSFSDVPEMAKDFLSSYQSYSGNQLYGELRSSLTDLDSRRNLTKTVGNTKLEVSNYGERVTFRWLYTLNGIDAPDKVVALGYENGFLEYFYDSWDLYKIGSTEVNVSEEEAITLGMARAKDYSWPAKSNDTLKVTNFNVTNAMIWETVFRSSLVSDEPRNEDLFMLFPMRHVWVSLDKFYPPGNVYGFNVYVWADTGEVCHIQERFSTIDPPPELVANVSDLMDVKVDASASAVGVASSSLDTLIGLVPFGAFMIGVAWVWTRRKTNLYRRRFIKLGGLTLCLLTLTMFSVSIATVNAASSKGRAVVWGSESSGAYYDPPGWSWRKHPSEVYWQDEIAEDVAGYFSLNGYEANDYQGDSGSDKTLILKRITQGEAYYPRMAVVDFDHGNGFYGIPGLPYSEFHYIFEDQTGTRVGPWYQYDEVKANGVSDYEIYPRTAEEDVFFAFINTCNSAHVGHWFGGSISDQGIIPGTDRARGMPFSWSHRLVKYKYDGDFNTAYHMSDNGYARPDSGDFVFIGFDGGSAALWQRTEGSTGSRHYGWVREFFDVALTDDLSVNDALDTASRNIYEGKNFDQTNLYNEFLSQWPMWNSTHGWVTPENKYGQMKVYGNGNIHLYQDGGIWHFDGNGVDDLHDNDGDIHGASWTNPKFGSYALNFDGSDDYVEMYPFDYDFTEITAEFWMKTSDTTKTGTPISCSSGTQHNEFLLYNYKSFNIYVKGSSVSTGVSANDGKWHHIAVTWRKSDGQVKLYKDGIPVYTGTLQSGATINLANLIIGQEQDSFRGGFDSGQAFKGDIDEVCIYDYVLSDSQIADNAVVASYHLNGGSVYDSSPNGNDGSPVLASWATGVRGYGLGLDGDDAYAYVVDSPSLDLTNEMSIELWFKPTGAGSNPGHVMLARKAEAYAVVYSSNNYGLDLRFGDTWYSDRVTGQFTYNKWYHLVVTFSVTENKIRVYKNGNLIDTINHNGQANSQNNDRLRLGSYYGSYFFEGIIDEVRIYDRALSTTEITTLYNQMSPTIFYKLNVLAYDQYGAPLTEVPFFIDDEYIGNTPLTCYVTPGNHEIYVPYDLYILFFDYYYYNGQYYYNNEITISVTSDNTIKVYYYSYYY